MIGVSVSERKTSRTSDLARMRPPSRAVGAHDERSYMALQDVSHQGLIILVAVIRDDT